MTVFVFLLLLLSAAGIIVLDARGKISVISKWNVWYVGLLLPHILLVTVIGTRYIELWALVPLFLFSAYCLVRMHFCPVLRDESDNIRLLVMIGGRKIILLGLASFLLQCMAYLLLWKPFQMFAVLAVPTEILIIDAVITGIYVMLLLLNGLARILFTSRRLGIIRRVVFFLTWWIPVFNIIMILYFCRLVRWEYDHEYNKVMLNKVRVDSQVCATRYPLLLVHGFGFRDLKYLNYWGRIPREIMRNGARVYYGHQEAMGTIEDNAGDMKARIFEILEETHCGKVNIIAHSKGGLDARYLISELHMGPYIASLTTISTPHRGSELLDVLTKIPDRKYRKICSVIDRHFRKIGDRNPDSYTSSRQMKPSYAEEFNSRIKDDDGVYYQSYAIVMRNMFSDSLLCIPNAILKHVCGPNDGLVCIDSAKWGDFRGVLSNKYRRGISHGDIIDLKREDIRGFDVMEQYVKIISELKEHNF